jgi:uncharacterized protein DUF6427
MIKYFNSGYISRYIIVFLMGLVLWLPFFIFPINYFDEQNTVNNQVIYLFGNPYILSGISFIFMIITSIFLNRFAIDNGFIGKISTLVLAFSVIFSILLVGEIHSIKFIGINFILIFVWANLMQLPYAKNVIPVIFNASFLIGIASFFYPQLILLFILVWISIIVHRVLSWRGILITLIGIVLPYAFLFVWYFSQGVFPEKYISLLSSFNLDINLTFPDFHIGIIVLVIFLIILVISAFGTAGKLNERSINLRRNLIITLYQLAIAFCILILSENSIETIFLLVIPGSIITAHWFSNVRKTKWYNILFVSLVILVFLNNYLTLVFTP